MLVGGLTSYSIMADPKQELWDEIHKLNQEQRFHLHPTIRLSGIAFFSGFYGLLSGGRKTYNETSLRFLAENSHRLPKTKGHWYFYHKRKNYVCMKESLGAGMKTGIKYSFVATSYFGLEAFFDYVRGKIDFINTTAATVIAGGSYAKYHQLSKYATLKMMKNGLFIGLINGVMQDALYYVRNGELWYLKNPMTTAFA